MVTAWARSSTIARTTALPWAGPEMVSRRDERGPIRILVEYVPGFSVTVPPVSRMAAIAASNPAAEPTLRRSLGQGIGRLKHGVEGRDAPGHPPPRQP